MFLDMLYWLVTPRRRSGCLRILVWWEIRRFVYNIIVFPFGIIGLSFAQFLYDTFKFPPFNPTADILWIFNILFAAIIANLCYCGGAFFEVVAAFFSDEKAKRAAPWLWAEGLIFSIAMCFLPAAGYLFRYYVIGK